MGFSLKNVAKKAVKAAATGGASVALSNKSVAKAVTKMTAPVGKRVGAAATAMRLPSIATNINIKKAITDPVGYAKSNAAAYAKDATVAVSIYSNLKKGNVKGLVTQGIKDTKAAAKAVQTGKTPAVSWDLDSPKVPELVADIPTYSQLTGDTPLEPMSEPEMKQNYVAVGGDEAKPSKLPIILGAVAAVVLLVVVLK